MTPSGAPPSGSGSRRPPHGGRGPGGGLASGSIIDGRYEIRRLIGRGGQGDVYLAFDRNFAIEVAMKFLHPDYRSEEVMERFRVDAQATVRLSHPNVVRVYDFNPQYPYLVMEHCGDGDLDRFIKSRRRSTLRDILEIVRQISEALAVAHENVPPILHRDIKPGNVLFKGAVPKLTDFGLAKMLREGGGLTTTRGMMGTVRYCSPQQLRDASKVDHRADLWSVGVVLYELLFWSRPFDRSGDDQFIIMRNIDAEPPRQPPYAVPAPVTALLHKCLEKDPARRYASARDMSQAVAACLAAVPDADRLLPPENVVDELSRMASEVAGMMSRGQSQDAMTQVSRMRHLAPDDSLVRYWGRQVRHSTDSGAAPSGGAPTSDWSARLDAFVRKGEYREARRVAGEWIVGDPDSDAAQEAPQRIGEEEKRFKQAIERAMTQVTPARAAGDARREAEIWQGVLVNFPENAFVQGELARAEGERREGERRAQRDSILRQARAQAGAGQAAEAVAALRRALEGDPGSVELQSLLREVQREAAQRARAGRLAILRQEIDRRSQAGDAAGAVALCEEFLQAEPGAEEVEQVYRDCRQALEEARRAAARRDLDAMLRRAGEVVASARFRSLPRELAGVGERIKVAQQAQAGDRRDIGAARDGLATALAAAERALAREIAARRERLSGRYFAALDWLGAPADLTPAGSGGDHAGLRAAAHAALGTLTSAGMAEGGSDPIDSLGRAETALAAAIETVARQQQSATEALRGRAREASRAAAADLKEALALARGEVSAASGLKPLEDQLRGLESQIASGGPRQLEDSVGACRRIGGLAAAVGVATAARSWRALDAALAETADLLATTTEGRVPELARQAAKLLAGGPGVPDAAGRAASMAAELKGESAALRETRTKQVREVQARWDKARAAWKSLVLDHLGSESVRDGQRAVDSGAAAFSDLRSDDVVRWTGLLEGLTRRCRLESAWIDQCGVVLGAESRPRRGDGDTPAPVKGSGLELVERYRQAVATGEVPEMTALASEMARLDPGRGRREPRPDAAGVPAVGAAARRLNQRLAPGALAEFDRLESRHRQAAQRGQRGEAHKALGDLVAAERRLLIPIPLWRRPAPVAASVALAAALTAAWMLVPAARYAVTVMSPHGTLRVSELSLDGARVPPPAASVGEEGALWSGLRPGRYRIAVDGGAAKEFTVPGESVVLLPGGGGDFDTELQRELGLGEGQGEGS